MMLKLDLCFSLYLYDPVLTISSAGRSTLMLISFFALFAGSMIPGYRIRRSDHDQTRAVQCIVIRSLCIIVDVLDIHIFNPSPYGCLLGPEVSSYLQET